MENLKRAVILLALLTAIDTTVAHAEVIEVPRGGTVLRAGSPFDGIVLLMRGRASHAMVNASSGTSTTLDTLQPGDHAGDVAAVLRGSQPYNLVADEPLDRMCVGGWLGHGGVCSGVVWPVDRVYAVRPTCRDE